MKDKLPLEPTEMATVLTKLIEKKYSKDRFSLSASVNGIALEGDKEVIEWFSGLVKTLSEK